MTSGNQSRGGRAEIGEVVPWGTGVLGDGVTTSTDMDSTSWRRNTGILQEESCDSVSSGVRFAEDFAFLISFSECILVCKIYSESLRMASPPRIKSELAQRLMQAGGNVGTA